jgi:hypothetical protein
MRAYQHLCMPILVVLMTSLAPANYVVGQSVASPQTSVPTFVLPLSCEIGRTCEVQNYVDRDPNAGVADYQCGSNSYQDHNGTDFRILDLAAMRAGVAVVAAAPGRVSRVRDGVSDVSVTTIGPAAIAGRECGNGVVIDHANGLSTQYCHLRNGSITARVGTIVSAGDPIGQVGLSGNTEYPHLHFSVRRGETEIDPFAPMAGGEASRCGSGQSLWREDVARALTYKAGVVLNSGFGDGPITMAQIEERAITTPTLQSPALTAYVRAINLRAGDVQSLVIKAPDGSVLASSTAEPLPRNQAQRMLFIGKRRPPAGWAAGTYLAEYRVMRGQTLVTERQFTIRL